jgi:hypothetical protein
MTEPSLALQGAIVAALKAADTEVGPRVYDHVPPDRVFPYVAIDGGQVLSDEATCSAGSEIFVNINVWSRAVGFPETCRISGQIREALHDADLDLEGNVLDLLVFDSVRYLRDPKGEARHGVLTFRALTRPDP